MSGIGSAAKTAEELKKELDGRGQSPEEIAADLDEPRLKKEWSFHFHYKDPIGRVWDGDFTNRILSLDDINRVGTIRAGSCNYAPLASLDMATLANSEQLAHLTVSLVKRPKWAANLGELLDPEVLNRLYQEVSSHEDIFRGRGPDQASGAGREGDGQG